MKLAATRILICWALLLGAGGCSDEEQAPERKAVLAKPIRMPIPREPEAAVPVKKEITEPEEKNASREDTQAGQEIQATAMPEPGENREEEPKPLIEEKAGEEEKATPVEEEKATPVQGEKATPAEEKPLKAEEATGNEKETKRGEEAGYYAVSEGDTLSSIAGRKDVYGDPLKWPILFRQNAEALGDIALDEKLPDRQIPEDKRVRFLTPEAIEDNLKSRPRDLWVVNIFSGTTKEEILPQVVKLLKLGYPIYITRVEVRGTEWMRLRLGFFATKREADEAGDQIMALLKLKDSWSAKVGEKEFEEFGGF